MTTERIILFRHGPAGAADPAQWPDDSLRPLTTRGVQRTRLAAAGLARLSGPVRAIWTSPYLRAEATAGVLRAALDGEPRIVVVSALAPGHTPRDTIERLQGGRGTRGTIVIVGHEPDLGRLAGALAFGTPRGVPLKKAGACAIEFEHGIVAGRGRLQWLLPPRVLRGLAPKRARRAARKGHAARDARLAQRIEPRKEGAE